MVGNTIFGSLSREYKVNWGQVFHEVVHRLVSHLEKNKASPISPYLFHLYSRNECLNEEEMDEIGAARKYLELGVSPETVANPEEEESERGSLSSKEQFRTAGISSSGRLKHTYKLLEGSPKFQNPDWRSMRTFEGDPFQRVFDDLEQLHYQYNNLDTITTRASKLLGDCKVGNIVKELKKLKEEDTKSLKDKVADLTMELVIRKDEIKKLKKRVGILERIKEVVGTPGDIFNKARLFNEDVKTEGEVSAAKIIKVLVSFTCRMEIALVDIQKIVYGSSTRESSRPSMPPPIETPRKEKPLEEIKTPLPQRPGKEVVMEESNEVSRAKFMTAKLAEALVITPMPKVKKSENFEPSPRK